MTDPLLEVQNLEKTFVSGGLLEKYIGRQTRTKAVKNLDLEINNNETVALVGESGCGKSTLAKTILGMHVPTAGSVFFKGERLTSGAVAEKPIQMIFQDPDKSLNPRRTIGNILTAAIKRQNPEREDVQRRVDELLTNVELGPEIKNRYPNAFSGGQKQRIAIARALAAKPELLIADELVSGLDVSVQAKILNLLKDLQHEMDLSILVISHNLGIVQSISDRVNIMYLGEIVERGNTEDIFDTPAHPYTRALLSSVHPPDPDTGRNRIPLDGELPNPSNPPAGCQFHTRCPEFIEGVCDQHHPEMRSRSENPDWPLMGDSHEARCVLLDERETKEPIRMSDGPEA